MRRTPHIMRRLCLIAVLLTLFGNVMAMADDTHVASVEESWTNARKHYAKGQYQSAFNDFYWAAIRDHPQAQQMVGLMYLLGPEAFGLGVKRDRAEAAFWMREAQIRGVDVNEHMRCTITRRVSERRILTADRAIACLEAITPNGQMEVSTKVSPLPGSDRAGRR